MSRPAADALKLVEETLDAVEEAGWRDTVMHHDGAQGAMRWLYYIRTFLMFESNLDRSRR